MLDFDLYFLHFEDKTNSNMQKNSNQMEPLTIMWYHSPRAHVARNESPCYF